MELSERMTMDLDAASPRSSSPWPMRRTRSSASPYLTFLQPLPSRSARKTRLGAAFAQCTSHSPTARACPPSARGERSRRVDRKSTRLNSSHDQISYAVFCLKKKKKKNVDAAESRSCWEWVRQLTIARAFA